MAEKLKNKNTKKQLSLNNNWFRELYEYSPLMYFIIDSDGYVLSVNKKGAEVLGYCHEELLGQQVLDVFHPDDKELVIKQIKKCLKTPKKVHNWELRKICKDGSMLWVKESARVISEDNQKFIFIICEDISEQKKTDADLKDKLEELANKNRYEKIISTVTRSVHSSININDVFDNAVQAINKNINNADIVGIFLVEGQDAILTAHRGYSDWLYNKVKKIPYPKGYTWKLIKEGKPLYCSDAEKDKVIGPAGKRAGTKSYTALPIKFRRKTIGCISINSYEKNAFNKEELNLFKIVTQQIEVAIHNAKQAEQLHTSEDTLKEKLNVLSKKNRYEEIINIVTRSVHSSINFQEVLENAVEVMSMNIEGVKHIGIHLVEGQVAVLKAYRGHPLWFVERVRRIPYPKGFTWKTINEGKPIYCEDVDKDDAIGPAGREVGTKSYLSMPIHYNNETIGCINVHSFEKKAFNHEELALLESVAQQIQAAINNARQADALRESETRYRTLYDQSPVGVITFNNDLKITSSNKRLTEILKTSPENIIGLELKKLTDQKFTHIFEKALQGQTAHYEDYYINTSSNLELWLSVSAAPLSDTDGNILGGMAVVEDVTKRKKMEESIVKSQKLESLGILAGGIAHDFNNLLTSIMGNLSIAKSNPNIDDQIMELFCESEDATARAADLVSQLLTFSKGGAPVKKVVSNFGDFISDIANFALTGSKVKCNFSIEEKLWSVEVDESQISQVIENLVINAQQAMPGGGIIKVSAMNLLVNTPNKIQLECGKYIKITIEDYGVGISEENLHKIFDPYFTTKEQGHGLGLSSVYSIVNNHYGKIDVKSKLGEGTEISIYLPASERVVKTKSSPKNKISQGKGRILLMDDEALIKKAAGRMLTKMGFEVEYSSDGLETVDKYIQAKDKHPFDLVIMDLTIPGGMGGREAIQILKSIDPDIKAIVSSGYSNDLVMSEYKKFGFKDIIKKPYRLEILSNTINNALKQTPK